MNAALRWSLALATLLAPGAALACPYCAASSGTGTGAWLAGTALLLGIPLLLVGGLLLWLRRAAAAAESERTAAAGGAGFEVNVR